MKYELRRYSPPADFKKYLLEQIITDEQGIINYFREKVGNWMFDNYYSGLTLPQIIQHLENHSVAIKEVRA